jgi:hypothetical protein
MPLSLTGELTWITCARRMWEYARFGKDNGAPNLPIVKNNESILAMNAAGTGTVSLLKANASDGVELPGSLQVGTAGIIPISAPHGFANWQPAAATSGTDTTPADGTQFVSSLWIPANKTLTGVAYLIGSVGGTDKVYAALYSSSGALLANSSVTSGGATVGTAANVQTLAFTATYAAKGPGLFYVGISMNGNTARLRSVPAHCQAGLFAGSVSQVHGTVAAITAPTTFTADKAPVAFVY